MKKLKYLFISFICLLSWQSCVFNDVFDCEHGRGQIIEETFDISSVHSISLRMDATVFLTQGNQPSATISAQANIIDEIDFRVRNHELVINNDRCLRSFEPIEIFITLPEIRELSLSGSGLIVSEDLWLVDDLHLNVSGSGGMVLEVEGDNIFGRISGSGNMDLRGIIDDLRYTVSGSGSLYGFDLETQTAEINISGSGNVELTVLERLDVRISGSGNVYYKGNPTIESRVSGSGRLIDAN